MDFNQIKNSDWNDILSSQFSKEYFIKLEKFIDKEREEKTLGLSFVYPPEHMVFNAFNTSFKDVNVVILGQDCYTHAGQAHGLSFSVLEPTPPPPSLVNIYKELESDIVGWKKPNHGNLTSWANQGVFLLNTILTVHLKPMSHANKGWEIFTTYVIQKLSERGECIFLLWGSNAKSFSKYIDESKNALW